MDQPTVFENLNIAPDTTSIVSYMPLPGLGVLPINAFVVAAEEPVLVDTGLSMLRTDFMARLREAIDPRSLKWIWLTHTDADHIGNLEAVLAEAPEARVVTSYLGMGKLGLMERAVDRTYFINPGQSLDVGDRKLVALRPPTFDAPETTGFFDTRTRTLFSADSFGALMDAPEEEASAVSVDRLREGMTLWATIDAPWLPLLDAGLFGRVIQQVRSLDANVVLSSHLPPARNVGTLLGWIADARKAPGFVGPDQAAIEAMFAGEALSA